MGKKMKGGFLEGITGAIADTYDKAKAAVTGTAQPVVDDAVETTGISNVATPEGVEKTFGTAREAPGRTMAGGKKYRKTRKSKKGSKKTMRRKH